MGSARLRLTLSAAALLCAGGAAIWPAGAVAAPASWRLEQPAPPPGATFKVPLGAPGDLRFLAPNRGLLSIEGNAAIARGLYFYDGVRWRQHATVCGGDADTARVAWAGPREYWTVTEPSRPRAGAGTALCHIKDGSVVGSFSTADSAVDPFRQMTSAACRGPSDCWFGGVGAQDPLGQRLGAFHLHYNGTELRTVYAPQGRGVSAMTVSGGRFLETTFVGRARENTVDPVDLAEPEDSPSTLHAIGSGGVFTNEPFVAAARPGVPADGTELLAIDANATDAWAAGGGAASGPSAPPDGNVARPPVAVRRVGGAWQEVPLDETQLRSGDIITAIAPIPGSVDAMAAVTRFSDRGSTTAKARVARISPTGAVEVTRLPVSGAGRGSAARIACPAPEECWMVTTAGWVFHFTDGASHPQTTDAAFGPIVDFRPNESAEQFIPDAPPVDNSQLFAPPPPEEEIEQEPGEPPKAKPVIKQVKRPQLRGQRLTVRFTVVRKARIGLVAYRGKRVVARARLRLMKPGKRKIVLKLSKKRSLYPKRLKFNVKVPGESSGGQDNDTVTTGP